MTTGSGNQILKVVIIGSGNVATHISKALIQSGFTVSQIYSRTSDHAQALAESINTKWTTDIHSLDDNADLYLFLVSDYAIEKVLGERKWQNKFLVHMAGSIPMDVFKSYSNQYGVFYVLQSFSAFRKINLNGVPVFIEANTNDNTIQLQHIAERLSLDPHRLSSEQRKSLHLVAMFASNFVNHMFSISQQISEKENISFEWFKPLIAETISKAMTDGPLASQTGPARRNDKIVLENHIEMLKDHPEWQKIYTFVSESIRKMYE